MSRDSGSGDPSQRTVAELLAEHGGGSQRGTRRRRRRAEDPTETAPQTIIDRVNSDSGRMRPIVEAEPPAPAPQAPAAGPQSPQPPPEPQQTHQAAPTPASGSRRPAEHSAEAAQPPGGANFWARKFAAANGSAQATPSAARQPERPAGKNAPDPEATARHPSLAESAEAAHAPQRPAPGFTRGQPPNAPPAAEPARADPAVEGITEQFPLVDSDVAAVDPVPDDPDDSGTALLAYPPEPAAPGTGDAYGTGTAYGHDSYGTGYYDEDGYGDNVEDSYDVDPYRDDPYAVDDLDDDEFDDPAGQRLPAGMGNEDYEDYEDYPARDLDGDEPPARSPAKEWLVLGTQVGAGLLAGGLVWVGFQWLWTAIPVAALVAALVATGALVLVARKILRTDDLQTILLAVLVGLVCTVSPAALLLVGY